MYRPDPFTSVNKTAGTMHEEPWASVIQKTLVAYIVALHFDVNLIQHEDYILLKIIAFLHTERFAKKQNRLFMCLWFDRRNERPDVFTGSSRLAERMRK